MMYAPQVRARNSSMLHLAVLLDDPSTDWWHVDPKDAPNRESPKPSK